MIQGTTLTKRNVFDKRRGNIIVGTLAANATIIASENKFQWLHLVDGGWVSAGSRQQYIKWKVVTNTPIITPKAKDQSKKIIIGKTLIKRDVFDKPRSKKKIRSLDAEINFTASDNLLQWLHLVDGGWINAGPQQQYIKWMVVPDKDNADIPPDVIEPFETPISSNTSKKIIAGITLKKRNVFNKPRGKKKIRTLEANTAITASDNIFQWLHLVDGGWVSAGPRQQYIKWEVVPVIDVSPPTSVVIEPIVTPSPPNTPWPITEIKRTGKIATLLVDWLNPKWKYTSRPLLLDKNFAHPQTVTFNSICASGKGPSIPLTDEMANFLIRLNGIKAKELILTKGSGWVNVPTKEGTIEKLSWAANHVIVKESKFVKGVEFYNIYALNCYETDLVGNFFDKDMRLILHKFNAVNRKNNMMKLANGRDCYTPLITDPEINNGDMWILSEYLEMWPELPYTISDGTQIIEYELFGYNIYGLRADGKSVLLRDPDGFKTNWKINSPEVPI